MGFFFGSSRKNNALSSSSSKVVNNKKISHQKKKKRITRDSQPQQDLLPLDDLIEKPESTLTFDPSDSESEGSCKLTTKCTSDDDESEILVDELSRGTPKFYGENESHDHNGVGAALADNNTKVVLTGKLPMSIVTVNTKAANEEMSVVSSLSRNSMSSHSSHNTSNNGCNRQSFSQMRKEAPKQHLFKIPPKGQPPKQKNNLLKYTQSTKAAMASEVKGYLRYVAKGAEENDRSIYST